MRKNLSSFLAYHGPRPYVVVLYYAVMVWCLHGLHMACKPKAKPEQAQTSPLAAPVDSVRSELEINVAGSNNTVIISQGNSQTAVNDYEKAKDEFDKTRVTLP